uniref:Translation initiation factor IF- 2 domain-containing protein n=1 Tax=Timema cristinae TaxID=61476 RepID=A0A7R9D052_TIMCR|nr:unnamed protein product [Timema cristinae]
MSYSSICLAYQPYPSVSSASNPLSPYESCSHGSVEEQNMQEETQHGSEAFDWQSIINNNGYYVASALRETGDQRAMLMQHELSNVIFKHMSGLSAYPSVSSASNPLSPYESCSHGSVEEQNMQEETQHGSEEFDWHPFSTEEHSNSSLNTCAKIPHINNTPSMTATEAELRRAHEVMRWRKAQKLAKKQIADQEVVEKKVQEHYEVYKAQLEKKRLLGKFKMRPTGPREKEIKDDDTGPKISVIVKGDVDGSVEAILDVLETYDCNADCTLNLIHYGVGMVSETDIELAEIFKGKLAYTVWPQSAIIYTFNVKIPDKLEALAKSKRVVIKQHNIIYRLVDDLKAEINSRLPLKPVEEILVAGEVEPYLKIFQNDNPMLPFVHAELYSMARSIAARVLKREVIRNVKNSGQLLAIDVKNENLLSFSDVDIGFGAKKFSKNVKELDVQLFRKDCRHFLVEMFQKLIGPRSPLRKCMVKGASCLSPAVMTSGTLRVQRVNIALEQLTSNNHIAYIEAEHIRKNYLEICEQSSVQDELKTFDFNENRLDSFLFNILINAKACKALLSFCTMIFTMFHGNSAVERGFSVNKECLVENMKERSLISQRSIYSAVQSVGGIKNVEFTSGMLHAARRASSKRREAIEEMKKKESEEANRSKTTLETVNKLEAKKRKLLQQAEEEASALQTEIDLEKKRLRKM